MSTTWDYNPPEDPTQSDEPLELFPVVMVYATVRCDHSRGWNVSVSVQTPDGKDVFRRWSRSGGSLNHGLAKVIDDITHAYQMAARIGPFDDPSEVQVHTS